MYFLSVFAVIFVSFFMVLNTYHGASLFPYFVDMPSMLMLLLITFPMLISSGLLKDFNRSFKLVISKKQEVTLTQLKRSLEAVNYVIKTLLYVSIFTVVSTLVIVYGSVTDTRMLYANLAVAVLPMVYGFFLILILLPVKTRLKVMIIDFVQDN